MIDKSKLKNLLWILDIFVFVISFFFLHYQKFGIFFPRENYFYLFLISISLWIIFSIYYDKINSIVDKPLLLVIRIVFWSSFMSILFIVIVISFSDLWSISRIFMVTFMTIMVLYELTLALLLKIFIKMCLEGIQMILRKFIKDTKDIGWNPI